MPSHPTFRLRTNRCVQIGGIAALVVFSSSQAYAQLTPPQLVQPQLIPPLSTNETQPPAEGLTLQAVGTEALTSSSNPVLAVTGARSLWGSTTSPELILNDATPETQLNLDTRVDENVFNQGDFDSTDVHETAGVTTQNERWTVGVQEHADDDTTRTSELTNYSLGPVIAHHLSLSVTPQVGFNFTPVDTLAFVGSAATSSYSNDVFINYDTFSATPYYTHKFDPLNSGIISVQAQQYQTTRNNAVTVDSVGPSVGWQTILTPRFTANASVGALTSRQFDFGNATDPWIWQYTFSGSLAFKGDQDTINLATARQQFPYGNGTEALQTSFSLSESHALNSLFSVNVSANYITSTYQVNQFGNLEDLASGYIGVVYHMTERVDLTASYLYRYETLTDETKAPQDNAFMVSLAYHPHVWALLQ